MTIIFNGDTMVSKTVDSNKIRDERYANIAFLKTIEMNQTKEDKLSYTKELFSKKIKPLTDRELIESYAEMISSKYNMDPAIIKSIIHKESRYNPKARNGNCVGLMQVSKRWHSKRASKLGVTDFYDPYSNILLGVDYLSELFDKYKDPRLVLMIYNRGYKDTLKLYKEGKISTYAKTVLKRAEDYRKGE
jgi:soluble lytic murein transglycosylase-like protein